jgi:hypothetical protein
VKSSLTKEELGTTTTTVVVVVVLLLMMKVWCTLLSLHGWEGTICMAAKVSGQCPLVLCSSRPELR